MLITSHPVFLFIFLSFAALLSFQGCVPNTKVPQFYMTTISLSKVKTYKQLKDDKQKLTYIINYPLFIFNKYQASTNIQSAVSPHALDIKQDGNKLSYFIKTIQGRASMSLSIQYNQEKWKKLDVSVILMSNPKIVIGQIHFQNPQLRISSSVTGKLPTNFKPIGVKSLTYIFGMDVTRNIPQQPVYQIQLSVVKVDLKESLIQIRISGSQKCSINKLSIGYIIFEVNADIQFGLELVSIENNPSYPSYRALDGSIFTQTNFVGIRAIQVIPQKGQIDFSIGIKQNAQNILQIRSNNKMNLQFAVFRVGNTIQNICSHCGNQNKINIYGNSISCVSDCPQKKSVKILNKNVQKCIFCSIQLFLEQSGGSCQCRTGFRKNNNGVCQETTSKSLRLYESTFSKANSECLQPNTYRSPGGTCQCKIGYQRQTKYNRNSCELICTTNGFYDNGGCVPCQSGTFPNNQLKKCIPCTEQCQKCLSEYTCGICKPGFQLNFMKVCTQICGDGQIFNDQCDDGNRINGDGCSSQCKAQQNYNCSKIVVNGEKKSSCTSKKFQATLLSSNLNSGTLSFQVIINPPPSLLTPDELKEIFSIRFTQTYPPKQIYISQDQGNLNKIRIACIYVNPPNQPLNSIIFVTFPTQDPKVINISNEQIKKKQLTFRSFDYPRI